MSYLYRTGNGRNNIAFTNTANSSTKYLRRLGSGRTNINWYTIPAGSTYNILQRNGTGRNNVLWSNLNIPKPVGEPTSSTNITSGIRLKWDQYTSSDGNRYGTYYVVHCRVELATIMSQLGASSTSKYPYININLRADTNTTLTKAEWTSDSESGGTSSSYKSSKIRVDSGTGNMAHWSATDHSGFNNANKATVYFGSNWITFHITSKNFIGNYGTTATEMTYSEYKSNIDFNTCKGSTASETSRNVAAKFDGYYCKIVFSTTW